MKASTGNVSPDPPGADEGICLRKGKVCVNISKSNTTPTRMQDQPIQYKYTVLNADSHVTRPRARRNGALINGEKWNPKNHIP